MVENLKHTGTVFDYKVDDQNFINDMLNADIGALQVTEGETPPSSDKTFEEED
jgi:hypothetical protein